jgi:hypothetical protein
LIIDRIAIVIILIIRASHRMNVHNNWGKLHRQAFVTFVSKSVEVHSTNKFYLVLSNVYPNYCMLVFDTFNNSSDVIVAVSFI